MAPAAPVCAVWLSLAAWERRLAGETGEPGTGECAPFCGDSGGVASDGVAEKSALVEDGESGDWPVGVCGSVGGLRWQGWW